MTTTSPLRPRIGFVGAGRMGEPMVRRLLAAGHPVTVLVRGSEANERLAAAGADVVKTAADVAGSSRLVICCLFSDAQLATVAAGADGLMSALAADSIMLSHTTGTPETLTRLAAENPRVTVLDAPVSGTAADIAGGRLTVLIGGGAAAVAEISSVVRSYAATIIHTGAFGTALTAKLVNNLVFAANSQIVSAAAVLGVQLGLDPDLLLRVLSASSGNSHAVTYAGRVGGVAHVERSAAEFLGKDVEACHQIAAAAGLGLGWVGEVVRSGPLALGDVRMQPR